VAQRDAKARAGGFADHQAPELPLFAPQARLRQLRPLPTPHVLARGGEPQYLNRFLHTAHPARGLDPEMSKLLLEGTSARLSLPLTGKMARPSRGSRDWPLVGQQQRVAQRGAGEAGRSDAHRPSAGGDRPKQDHRVKPGFRSRFGADSQPTSRSRDPGLQKAAESVLSKVTLVVPDLDGREHGATPKSGRQRSFAKTPHHPKGVAYRPAACGVTARCSFACHNGRKSHHPMRSLVGHAGKVS